ncbi:efflux RND transporter periplasmic adaptor subunit [Chryseobacterium arthrosphaerae]|uniref:HlyD family secretion protein n=1 Tax=Chryseobacterium arthrosphaerae TaxID=651561 RepID=UPI0023E340EA|nr:efflux RND transporter periplasmic adaptor subunit [Chryseobacterium arthrosphaerae]WES98469.1 efflux RND transporter periplasmic adaptor subunit [Chryseobacterium arthrosphaerae]
MIKKIVPIVVLLLMQISCNTKNEQRINKVAPDERHKIVGLAEIQPEKKIISLFSQTGGFVREIKHDIGDTIKKGDVIVVLDTQIEQAQLDQAMSKIAAQEAAIANNSAQLGALEVKTTNTKEIYDRNEVLFQTRGASKQDMNNSKFDYEVARQNQIAQRQAIVQAKARLGELQSDVQYAQTVLKQKIVRAPYDGSILSMDIKVGNSISTNQALGDFAPAGNLIAITEVDELFANQVRIGMKAYVRSQGKNDTLATGTVYLLSPYLSKKTLFSDGAANLEDRRVREVRILLDKNAQLIIGRRVESVIITK